MKQAKKQLWALTLILGLSVGLTACRENQVERPTATESQESTLKQSAAPEAANTETHAESESSAIARPTCGAHWAGKNWYAFGTSITDTTYPNAEDEGRPTGKYVKYLAEVSGLIPTDFGIAGGTIGRDGIHGGSANILERLMATDLSEADLITLEGFVNDYACAIAIGQYGDTDETTMYGAITKAVQYCLTHSDATVVLITESQGRPYTLSSGQTVNYSSNRKNSLGLTQRDYNDVILEVGRYLGVPVIDAGGRSGINECSPEYFVDHLHHSELGGKQYALTIWDELQHIHSRKAISEAE